MRKTTNQMPVIVDEPSENGSRDLRIDELPAQGATKEQEDALRGGVLSLDGRTRTSPAFDASDPASDVIAPST